MLSAVIVVVIAASAVWVYWDASKNKIGKVPGAKDMFNMSAGAWGSVALLFWIVGFPAYLAKRGDLIEQAKQNPIESGGRAGKAAAFSIIGGLWALAAFSGAASSSLPSCDSTNTKSLVGQIVNGMPLVKLSGAQFVSVKNVTEQGFNSEAEIRSCVGTLVTTSGETGIQYSVKWGNKDRGEFYVEARLQ